MNAYTAIFWDFRDGPEQCLASVVVLASHPFHLEKLLNKMKVMVADHYAVDRDRIRYEYRRAADPDLN